MNCDDALSLAVRLAPELAGRLIVVHRPDHPAPPGTVAFANHDRDGTARITFVAEPTVEVLLHEVGHTLPAVEPVVVAEPSARGIAYEAELVRDFAAGLHLTPERPPWTRHGADWIRRVCHLWFRAEQLGIPIRQCNIGATEDLDHGIDEYRAALGWEPTRCRNWSFSQIEAEPMPKGFIDCFIHDTTAWLRWKESTYE